MTVDPSEEALALTETCCGKYEDFLVAQIHSLCFLGSKLAPFLKLLRCSASSKGLEFPESILKFLCEGS